MINNAAPIGLKQAWAICQMPYKRRLCFIAEGLPIIYESAKSLFDASVALADRPREAAVLEGLAIEEAAKVLILLDIVRCPERIVSSQVGKIIGWFYNHLARLIYSKVQTWSPVNVEQLREYVIKLRESHCLEGYVGEYIIPNFELYGRECALYADVEAYDVNQYQWVAPRGQPQRLLGPALPHCLALVQALSQASVLTEAGVFSVAKVWADVDFTRSEGSEHAEDLSAVLIEVLRSTGLLSEALPALAVRIISSGWQMPMYSLELTPINVPLDELRAQQEAMQWAEVGHHY